MEFQFESISAFFWMKGHGPYVWASYFITFVGIIYLAVVPRFLKGSLFKLLRAQKAREINQVANESNIAKSDTANQ